MKASYKIIKWLFGQKFFDKRIKEFDKLDPDRFYVENIRSYFGMSYFIAQRLCDEAVNNGTFDKKIGIECPECNRIIKSFDDADSIKDQETIVCEICEASEKPIFEYNIEKVKKIDIYSLHTA